MRITVLGAGVLGSILAAQLTQAGEEVILIARGSRAQFIQQHGVRLTGLANVTVPVHVVTDPRQVQTTDALIVVVKTYDTEAALASVNHMRVHSVFSIQNGVLKDEQLAHVFGWEQTLGAAAVLSGGVTPDGTVRWTVNEALYLGEWPTGISERVHTLTSVLSRAGIRTQASAQIQTVEWSKYVFIVSGMALAVLSRLETYRMFKDPDLARVGAMLEREIGLLAATLDIPLEDYGMMRAKTHNRVSLDAAVASIQANGAQLEAQGATAHKVSTLQDLERGRRLEVEEILGYAVRKGEELDVPLPTVDTCYRLITGINRSLL
ncbi:MAG: ketopantoate reductase family protein [Candidatus Tectomicrobia bacterium]